MARNSSQASWHLAIIVVFAWLNLMMSSEVDSQLLMEAACEPTDYILLASSLASDDDARVRAWSDALRAALVSLYDYAAYSCREVLFRFGLIGATRDAPVIISLDQPEGQIYVAQSEMRSIWATRRESAGERFADLARISGRTILRPALAAASDMLSRTPGRQRRIIWVTPDLPCPAGDIQTATIVSGVSPCVNEAYYQHYFFGNSPTYSNYVGTSSAYAGFEFDYGLSQFLLSDSNLSGSTDLSIVFFQPRSLITSSLTWMNSILQTVTASRGGSYVSPDAMQGEIALVAAAVDDVLMQNHSSREFLNVEDADNECRAEFVSLPIVHSGLAITISGSLANGVGLITAPNGDVFPLGIPYNFSFRNRPTASGYQVPAQAVTSDRPAGSELHAAIELDQPISGVWQITLEGICSLVEVVLSRSALHVDYRFPETVMLVEETPYYSPQSTDYIEIDVTTGLGTPILASSTPFTICAQIFGPSPRIDQLLESLGCLEFGFVADGLMRSVRPLPAPVTGTYRVVLEALLEMEDQTLSIFQTRFSYFVQE